MNPATNRAKFLFQDLMLVPVSLVLSWATMTTTFIYSLYIAESGGTCMLLDYVASGADQSQRNRLSKNKLSELVMSPMRVIYFRRI